MTKLRTRNVKWVALIFIRGKPENPVLKCISSVYNSQHFSSTSEVLHSWELWSNELLIESLVYKMAKALLAKHHPAHSKGYSEASLLKSSPVTLCSFFMSYLRILKKDLMTILLPRVLLVWEGNHCLSGVSHTILPLILLWVLVVQSLAHERIMEEIKEPEDDESNVEQ